MYIIPALYCVLYSNYLCSGLCKVSVDPLSPFGDRPDDSGDIPDSVDIPDVWLVLAGDTDEEWLGEVGDKSW